MIWIVAIVAVIALAIGACVGGIAAAYVRPALPPSAPASPVEPASSAPTHVMPLEQIQQKVARKYPGDVDRQAAIAKDIARAAAGMIPGAKPRGQFS